MGILCEPNTEGNININFIENNLCFCPSCGESAGENYQLEKIFKVLVIIKPLFIV